METETELIYCRLWRSDRSSGPKIIAHAKGSSLKNAMRVMGAPISSRSWECDVVGNECYITSNGIRYCGQIVERDKNIRPPKLWSKPRPRLRIKLKSRLTL